MFTAWTLLMSAIGLDIAATAALPRTQGLRDPGWTAVVAGGYVLSVWLLTLAVRDIPMSVAYAVLSGIGTAGVAVIGSTYLGEAMNPAKALALALIIGGVVLLNLVSTS